MRNTTRILTAVLLVCSMHAAPVSAASVVTAAAWEPQKGDIFVVDTKSNTGYLIHDDARYLPFLVSTGQQRTVRYGGQTYYAATPSKEWIAKEFNIQPDAVNFGAERHFLRLYMDGTLRTSYGIHSHRDINAWLQQPERYKSLGCVVVSEEMMDVIEQTYRLNGNRLTVITTQGPERLLQELAARDVPLGH